MKMRVERSAMKLSADMELLEPVQLTSREDPSDTRTILKAEDEGRLKDQRAFIRQGYIAIHLSKPTSSSRVQQASTSGWALLLTEAIRLICTGIVLFT